MRHASTRKEIARQIVAMRRQEGCVCVCVCAPAFGFSCRTFFTAREILLNAHTRKKDFDNMAEKATACERTRTNQREQWTRVARERTQTEEINGVHATHEDAHYMPIDDARRH